MISKLKEKIKKSSSGRKAILLANKPIALRGFKQVTFVEIVEEFRRQVMKDNLILRTSAISYNFAMAIPPTIIFLFTLIPHLPISNGFIDEMSMLIKGVIPDDDKNAKIIDFLKDIILHPKNGLLSFGFLLSIFFSSNAIMGLMRSFDKDSVVFTKRKGLQKRLNAIKMIITLSFLFILCMTLLTAQGKVLSWIGIKNIAVINVITLTRWLLIALLYYLIVSYIYRAAPAVKEKWGWFTPGAFLATCLMLIVALGFSWWVTIWGRFNQFYSSIGTILIVMIFIFINSLSLLIGFEVNVSIRESAVRREKMMVK